MPSMYLHGSRSRSRSRSRIDIVLLVITVDEVANGVGSDSCDFVWVKRIDDNLLGSLDFSPTKRATTSSIRVLKQYDSVQVFQTYVRLFLPAKMLNRECRASDRKVLSECLCCFRRKSCTTETSIPSHSRARIVLVSLLCGLLELPELPSSSPGSCSFHQDTCS